MLDPDAITDYAFSVIWRTAMTKKTAIALTLGTCLLLLGCDTKTKTVNACGDGFVDPGEQCDTTVGENTCASLGHYNALGELRCKANCTFDVEECGGRCGDSNVDVTNGEECDENDLNGNSCQSLGHGGGVLRCKPDCRYDISSCTNACGNGYVEVNEICDDGGKANGDGCSADCQVEAGWTCDDRSPTSCTAICGDEMIVGNEACDSENLDGKSCETLGFYGGTLACDDDCTLDRSSCETAGRCGDGAIQAHEGEVCDWQNLDGTSCTDLGYYGGTLACAGDCRSFDESGCALQGRCGDGLIQGLFEQCDGTNLGGQTCITNGWHGGQLLCSSDCASLDFSICEAVGRCGDGQVQSAYGEVCDLDNLSGHTCETRGYYGGQLGCNLDCRGFNESACAGRCGDGLIQDQYQEVCDGANVNGVTCASLGYHGDAQPLCAADCKSVSLSPCVAAGRCGDGHIQSGYGEVCDGINLSAQTCQTRGFHEGDLSCNDHCLTFNETLCAGRCGDGTIQAAYEQCDSSNLDGKNCRQLGYYSGTLTCGANCQFNTSSCSGRCGDYIVQSGEGEQCDREQLNGQTCVLQGWHPGTLACGDDCLFDTSGCNGRCGDELVQFGLEQCDGSNLDGEDCQSLGYHGGILTCASNCTRILANCEAAGWCGDGLVQTPPEQCDGVNLDWTTCRDRFFFSGTLACSGTCSFDTSACKNVVSVGAGTHHTCAVMTDGTTRCWGKNDYGQLGIGSMGDEYYTPQEVVGFVPADATEVTSSLHTCALRADGTALCWGYNQYNQLGNGTTTNQSTPVAVYLGTRRLVSISAGSIHTCALTTDNRVLCWGRNNNLQMGAGDIFGYYPPMQVPDVLSAVAVSTRHNHTCAVIADGTVKCWGANHSGQVGKGVTSAMEYPLTVAGLVNAVGVAAGSNHSCALIDGGEVRCWGAGTNGQLGNGSFDNSLVPVVVQNLPAALQIKAGGSFSCATTSAGAYCWGLNSSSQLGDGTSTNRSTATQVLGLGDGFIPGIDCGSTHACALVPSGPDGNQLLKCWGDNTNGKIGDGTTSTAMTPQWVVPGD